MKRWTKEQVYKNIEGEVTCTSVGTLYKIVSDLGNKVRYRKYNPKTYRMLGGVWPCPKTTMLRCHTRYTVQLDLLVSKRMLENAKRLGR